MEILILSRNRIKCVLYLDVDEQIKEPRNSKHILNFDI